MSHYHILPCHSFQKGRPAFEIRDVSATYQSSFNSFKDLIKISPVASMFSNNTVSKCNSFPSAYDTSVLHDHKIQLLQGTFLYNPDMITGFLRNRYILSAQFQ